MKKKKTWMKAADWVILGFIVMCIGVTFLLFPLATPSSVETSTSEGSILPNDESMYDTLRYWKYKRQADSVKLARLMKNGQPVSWSVNWIFLGVQQNIRCDTCRFPNEGGSTDYLLKLPGWAMKVGLFSTITDYYIRDGQSYIRKMEHTHNLSDKTSARYKSREYKIPFRYDETTNLILIPVSKTTYTLTRNLLTVLVPVFLGAFMYYVFGGFVKFLIEIAQGIPFSDRNVSRLKRISLIFLLIGPSVIALNYAIKIIFRQYFIEEIYFALSWWYWLIMPLFLGIVFYLLHLAFRRGKFMQEEQDLTI